MVFANPARSQRPGTSSRMFLTPTGVPVVEYSARVSPMRSCRSLLGCLVRRYSRSAPAAICASFSARRELDVLVSPPARFARYYDRGRIAVQVDVLLTANRLFGAHASHQAHDKCRHASARPDAVDPSACVPLQCRWCCHRRGGP
jgi:hypothetical protein